LAMHCADQVNSDLIIFPELACRYNINDLALRTSLQERCNHYLQRSHEYSS